MSSIGAYQYSLLAELIKVINLSDRDKQRFWNKVDRQEEDNCWPWKGERDIDDYGIFYTHSLGQRTKYRANRVSLYLNTNKQGSIARHSCDNPCCCNPKHLLWGSQQDNVQDMIRRGRAHWTKKRYT